MDKQNMVYLYNGILFTLKKAGNSDIFCNMDDSWGCYTKWNKPVTNECWLLGVGGGGNGELLFNEHEISVWGDESSRDGWLWWFHNTINILNATELYI